MVVCFVKKSGPFLSTGCIRPMYSISIFFILHFTYLVGVAYAPNAPPSRLRVCTQTQVFELRVFIRSLTVKCRKF